MYAVELLTIKRTELELKGQAFLVQQHTAIRFCFFFLLRSPRLELQLSICE